jgi:hypothetical protein
LAIKHMSKTPPRSTRPDDPKLREPVLLLAEWCPSDPKFGAINSTSLSSTPTSPLF